MHPYRTPATRLVEAKHKPRGWWKTFKLKCLIRWKGTWKERNWRCPYCKRFKLDRHHGPEIDSRPFFHMMRCVSASYADQERHEKNYWYAIAPDPDEDFLGPLR